MTEAYTDVRYDIFHADNGSSGPSVVDYDLMACFEGTGKSQCH
jgi:hypothetical protein